MKLIKPKAELLIQPNGLEGIYKQVELAGRTCYKSTDKITEDSAKPFVDRMINSNHLAMLEHGTVYLKFSNTKAQEGYCGIRAFDRYRFNPNSRISYDFMGGTNNKFDGYMYIVTNYRVLVENGWLDDLKYLCEPTEFHEKRYTFRCITSIGVTREMNRHRVNSIAEQSTRYCNYSKNKFGGEISFCKPAWVEEEELTKIGQYKRVVRNKNASSTEYWITSLLNAEETYMNLLKGGWQPQQAREVLPLCTATEIIHTAFASDWKHFFDLRYFGTTGKPHPNMLQLATLMKEEAEKHGIWNEISNSNK